MERKLSLFDYSCRMEDNRLVQQIVFGILDGQTWGGRLNREWLDDIKEWNHRASQTFTHLTPMGTNSWNDGWMAVDHKAKDNQLQCSRKWSHREMPVFDEFTCGKMHF